MRSNIFKTLLAGFAVVALTIGCVKKRPDMTPQGSGLYTGDTIEKSSIDGKMFKLITKQARNTTHSSNTAAEFLTVEQDVDFIDNYPLVDYETDAPLVGQDLEIKAEPGNTTDYQLMYKIVGKQLRIYKVAPENKIPFDEKTFAEKLPGNKLAVPLIAYPATHIRVEKARNADNRETNRAAEIAIDKLEDFPTAKHLRIVRTAQPFGAVNKSDVFPTKWFTEGEWIYSAIQIGATDGSNGWFPMERMMFHYDGELSRLKFRAHGDELIGESVNIDKRKANKAENYAKVITLPVKWQKYEVRSGIYGRLFQETETAADESSQGSAELPYAKVKFLDAVAPLYGFKLFNQLEDGILEEVIVAQNMVSWIVRNKTTKIRYNLQKYDPNSINAFEFMARNIHEEDDKKFGILVSRNKFDIQTGIDNSTDKLYQNLKIRRFAPGQIVEYHPTGEAQDEPWVNEVGDEATRIWNDVFRKAYDGYTDANNNPVKPPQIKWNSKPVRRGDPRYFKINYTAKNSDGGWLGLGNPHADPLTGQIIFATSHIYVGPEKRSYISFVYDYLKSKAGVYDGTLLIQTGKKFSKMDPKAFTSGGSMLQAKDKILTMLPDTAYKGGSLLESITENNYQVNWVTDYLFGAVSNGLSGSYNLVLEQNTNLERFQEYSQMFTDPNYYTSLLTGNFEQAKEHDLKLSDGHDIVSITAEGLANLIETECPEIKALGETITVMEISYGVDEEMITNCATRAMKRSILTTTVHEFGHNFGLDHNFYGSADADNHIDEEFINDTYGEWALKSYYLNELTVGSSSIMDYVSDNNPPSPLAGPYDVAAIRFSHTGRIETKDGEMVSVVTDVRRDAKIEVSVPIEVALQKSGKKSKTYLYCDDWGAVTGFDPMCARHDRGTTPIEVVENIIQDYKQFIKQTEFRFNKVYAHNEFSRARAAHSYFYSQLRKFYIQWRIHLTEVMGLENKYLEKFNPITYNQTINSLVQSGIPKYKNKINQYYAVRNRVFNFFKDEALQNDRYCVVDYSSRTEKTEYISYNYVKELADMRVNSTKTFRMTSCYDDIAKFVIDEYMKKMIGDVEYKIVADVGSPVKSSHYSTNSQDHTKPHDVLGSEFIRIFSMLNIAERAPVSLPGITKQFFPNLMDEPDLRDIITDELIDRVHAGARLTKKTIPEDIRTQFFSFYQGNNVSPVADSETINADNVLIDPPATFAYQSFLMQGVEQKQIPRDHPYLADKDAAFYGGKKPLIKFEREKDLISTQYRFFMAGLPVPGKIEATLERLKPFITVPVSKQYADVVNSLPLKVNVGRYYLIPSFDDTESAIAKMFMQKYADIESALEKTPLDMNKMNEFANSEVPQMLSALFNPEADSETTVSTEGGEANTDPTFGSMLDSMEELQKVVNDNIRAEKIRRQEGQIVLSAVGALFITYMEKNQMPVPKLFGGDGKQQLTIQVLMAMEGSIARGYNQLGSFGEALISPQKDQKRLLEERLAKIEEMKKTLRSTPLSELADTEVNMQAFQASLSDLVVQHNQDMKFADTHRDELISQKELLQNSLLTF